VAVQPITLAAPTTLVRLKTQAGVITSVRVNVNFLKLTLKRLPGLLNRAALMILLTIIQPQMTFGGLSALIEYVLPNLSHDLKNIYRLFSQVEHHTL
jgi:hypothetical protein